jgi:SAM-dependent methyltransferase
MSNDFYDPMAPFYHLVHGNWEESIRRQSAAIDRIIKDVWGAGVDRIHDVTCGIGTQVLGLAALGYDVSGADLSGEAVRRARLEAEARGLWVDFMVADMCKVDEQFSGTLDLLLSADNAVTHLLSEEAVLAALTSFRKAIKPGGGCLVSMRDYDTVERGGVQFKPFGVRDVDGVRWSVYQVWDWREGDAVYDFSMYFTADDGGAELKTHVMRSAFLALSPARMMALFEQAGFTDVRRVDGGFFPPVIGGTRPA